jgi:hypothetical protein
MPSARHLISESPPSENVAARRAFEGCGTSDLREFLQRLLEPLQCVFLFLVFCVRFLLLQRVLLRLLRYLLAGALKTIHVLSMPAWAKVGK